MFPNSSKTVKTPAVHKKNSKLDINNYRPISILPVLSKVFEKLFLNRMTSFCDKHNIIPGNQYGFRQGSNTTLALFDTINYIQGEQNKGNLVAAVLFDLSQAFDNVNHLKLVNLLNDKGFRGLPLQWLNSYLSNRSFYISINGKISHKLPINRGVPQGGNLSPYLFNLYVADLPNHVSFKVIQYADDTTILITAKTEEHLVSNIKKAYYETKSFFESLGLSLNPTKTEIVIFHNTRNYSQKTINLDHITIKSTSSTKFLGIQIDANLKMNYLVSAIVRKLCSLFPAVYHIREFLPVDLKRAFYFAYVHSHIVYTAIFLDLCNKVTFKKLESYYKKITKCIFSCPRRSSWSGLAHTHNIPSIKEIISKSCLKTVIKCITREPHITAHTLFRMSPRDTLTICLQHSCLTRTSLHNNLAIKWNELSHPEKVRWRTRSLRSHQHL